MTGVQTCALPIYLICAVAFGIVAAATTARAQEAFKTPSAAATALIDAARGSDEKRLRAILGLVGRDTGRIAGRMQSFNPDKGWEKVVTSRLD